MHRICYNAAQAFRRVVLGMEGTVADAEVQRMKDLHKTDPQKWKAMTMALRVQTGKANRTPAQRANCRTFIQELCREVKFIRQKKILLLDYGQYVQWEIQKDGKTQTQAEAMWAADQKDLNIYREEEGGVLRIAVALPTCIIHEDSIAKRRRLQSSDPLDDANMSQYLGKLQENLNPSRALMQSLPGAGATGSSSSSAVCPPPISQPGFVPQAMLQPVPLPSALPPSGLLGLFGASAVAAAATVGQAPASAVPGDGSSTIGDPAATGASAGSVVPVAGQVQGANNPQGSNGGEKENGVGDEEADEEADPFDVKIYDVANVSMFTSKKKLQQYLNNMLKSWQSPSKGRSWPQYLRDLQSGDLATCSDVEELGIETVVQSAETNFNSLKHVTDKKSR